MKVEKAFTFEVDEEPIKIAEEPVKEVAEEPPIIKDTFEINDDSDEGSYEEDGFNWKQ